MFCYTHGNMRQEVQIRHKGSNFESFRGREGPLSCTSVRNHQGSAWKRQRGRILGVINRTIVSRDHDVVLRLYKSLVMRNYLEYCVQAWSPYLTQDIDTLEQIQRRATKMIRGLGKFT